MSETVFVAILSLAGTLIGSLFGILAANRLITYRLSRLEETVNKHNNIIERTYILEGKVREHDHEIQDLKKNN